MFSRKGDQSHKLQLSQENYDVRSCCISPNPSMLLLQIKSWPFLSLLPRYVLSPRRGSRERTELFRRILINTLEWKLKPRMMPWCEWEWSVAGEVKSMFALQGNGERRGLCGVKPTERQKAACSVVRTPQAQAHTPNAEWSSQRQEVSCICLGVWGNQ